MMKNKKEFYAKDFLKEINHELFGNIFLFLGEEDALKEKCIKKIIQITENMYGKEYISTATFNVLLNEIQNFYEFIFSPSIFFTHKIAILNNVQSIQITNENKKIFSDILNLFSDNTIIIFNSSLYSMPKIFSQESETRLIVVKFWRLFSHELEKYISNYFHSLNLECDMDCIQYLIDLYGNDIKKIENALERLSLCCDKKITKSTIDYFITDQKEISISEFIDSIFEKSHKSFQLLHTLLINGIPELLILNVLSKSFENLMFFKKQLKNQKKPFEILNMLNIKEKQKSKFIRASNLFSDELILEIISTIYKTEIKIKSSEKNKSILSNPLIDLTEKILFSPVDKV